MIRALKSLLREVAWIDAVARTDAWQFFRHRLALIFQERKSDTFTRFLRVPRQFDALSGPVLDFLLAGGTLRNLEIVVLGCSNGAEVYSIASILRLRHPDLEFHIQGFDINPEMIDQAERKCYAAEDVFAHDLVTPAFVQATFHGENGVYRICESLAEHVCFGIADVRTRFSPMISDRPISSMPKMCCIISDRVPQRTCLGIFADF